MQGKSGGTIWLILILQNNLLDSIDWDNKLSGDINQAWDNWKQAFLSIMEQCIPDPHTTIKAKRNLPWIKIELIRSMRARNLAYKKQRGATIPNIGVHIEKKRNHAANELKRA